MNEEEKIAGMACEVKALDDEIAGLEARKAQLQEELDATQASIKDKTTKKDGIRAELLDLVRGTEDFKTSGSYERQVADDLVVLFCSTVTKTTGISDEPGLIAFLKEGGHTELLSVKESVKKADFKKALKADKDLEKATKKFCAEGEIHNEYVSVLTVEARTKQREHIEEKLAAKKEAKAND